MLSAQPATPKSPLTQLAAGSALIGALATLFASSVNAGAIEAHHAWVRAVPPVASNSAAYMMLINRSDQSDRLLGASSPLAGAVELHTVVEENGVMKMMPAGSMDIPSGGHLQLKPGGHHLMMLDLKRVPSEGESVPMTIRFERAGELTVQLPVQRAADHTHQPHAEHHAMPEKTTATDPQHRHH